MKTKFSLFDQLSSNLKHIDDIDNCVKITLGPTGKNGIVSNDPFLDDLNNENFIEPPSDKEQKLQENNYDHIQVIKNYLGVTEKKTPLAKTKNQEIYRQIRHFIYVPPKY
jgi:hypothetical protein